MKPTLRVLFVPVVLAGALSACVGTAPVAPPAPAKPVVTSQQRLANVRAVAVADDRELAVQPLRDPQVEDLRASAAGALQKNDAGAAAEALNQALLITPEDPAVLQERAEVALLQGEYERAETLAKKAVDVGSQVGPLCRRHWATIEQSRLARGEDVNAASAHAQIESCTVAGLNRF